MRLHEVHNKNIDRSVEMLCGDVRVANRRLRGHLWSKIVIDRKSVIKAKTFFSFVNSSKDKRKTQNYCPHCDFV